MKQKERVCKIIKEVSKKFDGNYSPGGFYKPKRKKTIKKTGVFMLFALMMVLSFNIINVDAALYTKSRALSSDSLYGCSASLNTSATYSTTGDTRWTAYNYSNYKVTNTSTYGITMTKASWSTRGSDPDRFHEKKFTWGYKFYRLGDPNMVAIKNGTRTATYYYNMNTNVFTVS